MADEIPHADLIYAALNQCVGPLQRVFRGTGLGFVLVVFADDSSAAATTADPRVAAAVLRTQAEQLEKQADAINVARRGTDNRA